ncbi:major tail protein [Mammaliicoccus sciuri]|uniref:major tail protein n=1 Tax=Mammaliicoccus sciuri TaxID=1296 RepID=UPI001C4FE781|nr:major tail protein [Mammaliicoccus sciuri]
MGKYNANTGLSEVWYATLEKESNASVTLSKIDMIDYLKEMSFEIGEELTRGYGSNKTAEVAKSGGEPTLNLTFHKLPMSVQEKILGLTKHKTNTKVFGATGTKKIVYVAVAFARTMEDGSKEWFGFAKGVFTKPNKEGQTKEGGVEFGQDEIEGQFMERFIEGFDEKEAVIMTYDESGETDGRDTVFQSIFGQAYPGLVDGDISGEESTEDSSEDEVEEPVLEA